nr:uncharacterized protein LOC117276403 isoform X2 [Nicotiana tomentosiformis]
MGTDVVVQTVPAGVIGHGTGLIQDTNGNEQQEVTPVDQRGRSGKVDDIEIGQLSSDQQKPVSKLPRDIPAATTLVTIYQVVGSALQNHYIAQNAPGVQTINDRGACAFLALSVFITLLTSKQ